MDWNRRNLIFENQEFLFLVFCCISLNSVEKCNFSIFVGVVWKSLILNSPPREGAFCSWKKFSAGRKVNESARNCLRKQKIKTTRKMRLNYFISKRFINSLVIFALVFVVIKKERNRLFSKPFSQEGRHLKLVGMFLNNL